MIKRDKIIVISDLLDSSIKSSITFYDIELFSSFAEAAMHLERVPESVLDIFISERELKFNATNAIKLKELIKSPFLEIRGNVVYMVYPDKDLEKIRSVFKEEGDLIQPYFSTITKEDIMLFIKGVNRESAETNTVIETVRMRKEEYLKTGGKLDYDSNLNTYLSDDLELQEAEIEIPDFEEILPEREEVLEQIIVSGKQTLYRSVIMLLLAQYKSQEGKVVLIEDDIRYHTLTELVTKSKLDVEFLTFNDIKEDYENVLRRISRTQKNLIFIGTIETETVDYSIFYRLIKSNFGSYVTSMIVSKELEDLIHTDKPIIVHQDTIPSILQTIDRMNSIPTEMKFLGVRGYDLEPINLSVNEMQMVISKVLDIENVDVTGIQLTGLILGKGGSINDLHSLTN